MCRVSWPKQILSMLILVSLIVTLCPFAEAADKTIHFQGKLKDAQGNLLSGSQRIRFQIWNGDRSVKDLGFYDVDCTNGLFNVELGKSGELNNLSFDEQYYVEVSFGENNVLSPRQPIGSAGYAHASLGDFNVNGKLGIGTTPTAKLHLGVYNTNSIMRCDDGYGPISWGIDRNANNGWGTTFWAWQPDNSNNGPNLAFATGQGSTVLPNNNIRMLIDKNGYVGIGTTVPDRPLVVTRDSSPGWGLMQVVGGASNSEAGIGFRDTTDGNGGTWVIGKNVGIPNPNDAFSWYYNGVKAVIDTNGNVGIGTMNPSSNLHIYSLSNPGNNYQGQLQIGGHYLSSTAETFLSIGTQQTGQYAFINVARTVSGAPSLVLNEYGGNVGIGTTSPKGKLHVNGNTTTNEELLTLVGTYSGPGVEKSLTWRDPSNITSMISSRYFNPDSGIIFGHIYNSGYQTSDIMTIRGNGKVGIGTTNPAGSGAGATGTKLDVAGNIRTYGQYYVDTSLNGGHGLYYHTNRDGLQFFGTGGADTVLIKGNGNVGIGTTNPTNKLEIIGNLFVHGSCVNTTSEHWTRSSDARLKRNIKALSEALDKLLELRGVNYEWKEPSRHDNLSGTQMGFVAQEVERVFPDWVSTDNDGYKGINMRGFDALAVEAIRTLKTENDELSKKNKALETKIEELKQKYNSIESRIVLLEKSK
ncbi:MAG: hypothetical protein A2293_00925 [Elusimicrobia bacterium RIFOXYB2_FULL_49_7]|nr:MAG: hypothetical protein A2293_00925 [Elusimicrobia bacterium RIFOXYB2_FULL_49_7]